MRKGFVLILCFISLCFFAMPVIGAPGYYEQLDLIASSAENWKQTDVFGLWGFTVTDLDQNGLVEIISASVQGTGFYTYIIIWEVNEDGSGLSEVKQARETYESAPDIMVDSVPVFFNPETGIYYYIFDDIIRNGYAEVYENKRAVFFKEGVWNEIPLASKATLYTDSEHFSISYTDPNGSAISGEQYTSIAESTFGTLEKSDFCLNWVMTDSDEFAQMNKETIIEKLRNTSTPLCPIP